jgi:hypothetical protein
MLHMCVCAFSLRRESPNRSWSDGPLIFKVVLSQGNQESPHMLLSPSEMGVASSSLLLETEALKNSTHHRSFLIHGTVSPPSFALLKMSGATQSAASSIARLPLGFSCARTHRSSSRHHHHFSSLDRIRRSVAPRYGQWGIRRAHLPLQASTVSS